MYFDMPRGFPNSRYMQVIARCRHPHIFPAIVHHDHTSRVQTVPRDGSGIRQLLEAWYREQVVPCCLTQVLTYVENPW
jgi:predicted NodU family carbamoyl transferase